MTTNSRWISRLSIVALLAVAALGMALRISHLDYPPLNLDEAESAINALTILQHGYPTDSYLGLPIFENTLTRPWPGHPEYEFRDTSYSDRGVAIYHGWLPLYAIAGSFRGFGIAPDEPTNPPRVQHELSEFRRRTIAARLPAVIFGGLFLVALYFATRDMFGPDAAAVAVVIASLTDTCVFVAREARYYSPTLLLGTLCCWSIWRIIARGGGWWAFVSCGVALALTFHTHLVTFFAGCAVLAITAPWWIRRRGALPRAAVTCAIVVAAVVPWAILTGFPGPASGIPPARSLMSPRDAADYLREHPAFGALIVAALGAAVIGRIGRGRIADRVIDPLRRSAGALALNAAWVLVVVTIFVLMVPASSAFLSRMTLPLQGPAIVLAAVLLASAARVVVGPRWPGLIAVPVCAAFFVVPGKQLDAFRTPPPMEREPLFATIDFLRGLDLKSDSRLYAIPFQHLPLTFYSGLPVQSVAPVRKSFFDRHAGEIVLIDPVPRRRPVPRELIATMAAHAGEPLTDDDLRTWEGRLWNRTLREDLAQQVARVVPPLQPLPEFAADAVARARETPPHKEDPGRWQNPAVFRGFECYVRADFWPVFFYRFVDPRARSGEQLNYAARMRSATATVLPSGWVVYDAPPLTEQALKETGR